MWPRFGNFFISVREVIITSTNHGLRILRQCDKRVKSKSKKKLDLIPTFVEIQGKKLNGELFVNPPPSWMEIKKLRHKCFSVNYGRLLKIPLYRILQNVCFYNSGQNTWNEMEIPVKPERTRKVWYVLLLVFSCYCQNSISGKKTWHYAMSPS